MTAYATRADLYKYGLPRGMLSTEGRALGTVSSASDLFELEDHGFIDDDVVLVRAAEGGTLAAPLVAGTPYYVRWISDSTFKLSTTAGGSAINLTSNGVSMYVSSPLPIDEVLEYYSRYVDDFLPAHAVPLTEPYPLRVSVVVAELAARRLQLIAGVQSGTMAEIELAAKAQLERWAKGIPLRDARASDSTNKAVTVASPADPRGWGSGGLP